ncbi:uncharacterized protein LOC126325825 [Schistocerca gregaria]|uniref:uncharacterized protein LOC126325825 n=1 Tax=Schistocerca gregaria TaxID=7010 RepID=UPI00211F2945|nr:uncharacterized protein LOC126325825 [Schistocerca gregaria]
MDADAGEEDTKFSINKKKRTVSFVLVPPFKCKKFLQQQKYLSAKKPSAPSVNRAGSRLGARAENLSWSESEDEASSEDTADLAQSCPESANSHHPWRVLDDRVEQAAAGSDQRKVTSEEAPALSVNAQCAQDSFLSSIVERSYQRMKDCPSFQSSVFWSKLYEAAQQKPVDSRFIPKLLHSTRDSLRVSTVINLYATGFSFDDQEQAYAYARNTTSITDAVNLGTLPGQVDHLLVRALSDKAQAQKKPSQVTFYEGGVIVEIRDYREGRAIYDEATQTLQPHTFRIYLRPELHNLIRYLDLQNAHSSIKAIVEQSLTLAIHPHLCLDPSPEVHYIASAINYRIQKFNMPFRHYSQYRNRLVPARETHLLPGARANSQNYPYRAKGSPIYFVPISSTTSGGGRAAQVFELRKAKSALSATLPMLETVRLANKKSQVFQHLMQISYQQRPNFEQSAPTHLYSEKKRPKPDLPLNPTMHEPVNQYPPVVGRWLFTIPRYTSQKHVIEGRAPTQMEWVTLKISLNPQSLGEYYASLRIGNSKPFSFQIGNSAAALVFIAQFKKIEQLASPEQTKSLSAKTMSNTPFQIKLQGQGGNGGTSKSTMSPNTTSPNESTNRQSTVNYHPPGSSVQTVDYKQGQNAIRTAPQTCVRTSENNNMLRSSPSPANNSPTDMNNYMLNLSSMQRPPDPNRKYGNSISGTYVPGMNMPNVAIQREVPLPTSMVKQPSSPMLHGHVPVPGGNAKYVYPASVVAKQTNPSSSSSNNYVAPSPANRHYIPPDTQRIRSTTPTFKISPNRIVPKMPITALSSPNEPKTGVQKKPG